MKVLKMGLIICLFIILQKIAIAEEMSYESRATRSGIVKYSEKNSKAVTIIRHKNKTKRKKDLNRRGCKGWCLRSFNVFALKNELPQISLQTILSHDKLNDSRAQARRYKKVEKIMRTYPFFLLRTIMNIYADKTEYIDNSRKQTRDVLFHKNMLKIPSEIFYPYTRTSLNTALINSGILYIPNSNQLQEPRKPNEKENAFKLFSSQEYYSNSYFQTNPLLYRTDFKVRRKLVSSRHTKYAQRDEKTRNLFKNLKYGVQTNLNVRHLKLDNFLGDGKLRSARHRKLKEIRALIGYSEDEAVLGTPNNEVRDVLGGMKIKSDKPAVFVIGVNSKAQKNIQLWLGSKARAKRMERDVGVVLEGKRRNKAINRLLKSMAINFQYQNRDFR